LERQEAEEALALVRQVVEKIHDTVVLKNWGFVMVVLGILDFAGFFLTHVFWSSGVVGYLPYVSLWVVYLLLALCACLTVRMSSGGSSSYVTRLIWFNGLSFYIASLSVLWIDFLFLEVSKAMLVIPGHIAAIGALCFTIMALIDMRFLWCTVAFFLSVAVISIRQDLGFLVLSITWFVCLVIPGLHFIREKKRLLRSGNYTEIV